MLCDYLCSRCSLNIRFYKVALVRTPEQDICCNNFNNSQWLQGFRLNDRFHLYLYVKNYFFVTDKYFPHSWKLFIANSLIKKYSEILRSEKETKKSAQTLESAYKTCE